MSKKYIVSPYSYGLFNNPTFWGIWNTKTKSWIPDMPMTRKRDAEVSAKIMNKLEEN